MLYGFQCQRERKILSLELLPLWQGAEEISSLIPTLPVAFISCTLLILVSPAKPPLPALACSELLSALTTNQHS